MRQQLARCAKMRNCKSIPWCSLAGFLTHRKVELEQQVRACTVSARCTIRSTDIFHGARSLVSFHRGDELERQVRALTDTVQSERATTLSALKEYQEKEASSNTRVEQCEAEVRWWCCSVEQAAVDMGFVWSCLVKAVEHCQWLLHSSSGSANGNCKAAWPAVKPDGLILCPLYSIRSYAAMMSQEAQQPLACARPNPLLWAILLDNARISQRVHGLRAWPNPLQPSCRHWLQMSSELRQYIYTITHCSCQFEIGMIEVMDRIKHLFAGQTNPAGEQYAVQKVRHGSRSWIASSTCLLARQIQQ
eukprot:scaffold89156_cov20-Tisochrysis_lutea.AAC.1